MPYRLLRRGHMCVCVCGACVLPFRPGIIHCALLRWRSFLQEIADALLQEGVSPLSEDAMLELVYV